MAVSVKAREIGRERESGTEERHNERQRGKKHVKWCGNSEERRDGKKRLVIDS